MKKIFTMCIAIFGLKTAAQSQPVIVSGFTGMASVNGTAYSRIGTVGDPTGGYGFVCASKDRTNFFGSSSAKRYIYYVNPSTFTITDSINYKVYAMSATNEPNTMFVRTDNGLSRINTLTKTITDSLAIPSAQFVAERPNSKEVWVTSDNKVYVVDYSGSLAATQFTVSPVSSDNGDMRFTTGGTLAYKVAWTSKKVYKINAASKTIQDSVVITGVTGPGSIEVSADSSKVFVTFPSDKKVRVYSTSTMTIIDSINCGTREPFDIYRHPDRAEIWIVNHFKDTVTVFNEGTYAQIAAINVTSSPHSLAFGTGTTGISRQEIAAEQLKVYPNPASGKVDISGIANGDCIKVYNTIGQLIYSTNASNRQEQLNISQFTAGNYIVIITTYDGKAKANIVFTKM